MSIGVLLADSNSGSPLFGARLAGKWQEEPSTGCHGNDDLSEGVDALWVASVEEQWRGASVYHFCKNDYRFDALQFDGPFSYIIPSSDQDMDDVTLGKLLTEAHRGQADYCDPEGVSVSQSSLSVFD